MAARVASKGESTAMHFVGVKKRKERKKKKKRGEKRKRRKK
jgi:hypothetical protein